MPRHQQPSTLAGVWVQFPAVKVRIDVDDDGFLAGRIEGLGRGTADPWRTLKALAKCGSSSTIKIG